MFRFREQNCLLIIFAAFRSFGDVDHNYSFLLTERVTLLTNCLQELEVFVTVRTAGVGDLY